MRRSAPQKALDLITFPLRAFTLFHEDKFGLSCLATERFDYAAREVTGYCLDFGCGRHNRFIAEFCANHGKGIDVFAYDGLTGEHIVKDPTKLPFADATFDTVTFIANINHVPKSKRDLELAEAYRCLKPGGNVVVTMGNPLAEIMVHQVVYVFDRLFKTNYDMDTERGMGEEEEYYLLDSEIRARFKKAGFQDVVKKYFWTQWGLNHLLIGWKRA